MNEKMLNLNQTNTFESKPNDENEKNKSEKSSQALNLHRPDSQVNQNNLTLTSDESITTCDKSKDQLTTVITENISRRTSKCPFKAGSESSFLNQSTDIVLKAKKKKGIKLKYLLDDSTTLDTLFQKSLTVRSNLSLKRDSYQKRDFIHEQILYSDLKIFKTFQPITCSDKRCTGSLMLNPAKNLKSHEEITEEAVDFINQFYASVKREGSKQHKERLVEVIESINNTGSYELKETELNFGARTAWRNASKCIGRIQWSKLQVFDARYVTTARG